MKRSYLFLQGPHGPFFSLLGRELAIRGHEVARVNFNGGDWFDWRGEAVSFTGNLVAWNTFCRELLRQRKITDLVVYGDCRPLHRQAIALAKEDSLRVHVFEEGYFRPDWITLEQDGVNGYSNLPRNAEWYLRAARGLSEPAHKVVGPSLRPLIRQCIKHYAAAMLLKPFFPRYRTHRALHPLREGWHWLLRTLWLPWEKNRSHRLERELLASKRPYYLACIQVSVDSQITCHSPFLDMQEFITHTIDSFARHAPPDTLLVFKNHPQDHGGFGYRKLIDNLGAQKGVAERCLYLDGGHLPRLIKASRGVVQVNSTVGTSALFHGKPTIALGDSVYNFAGLTCQAGLDAFWKNPVPPNKKVFKAFHRYLLNHVLINGGFYNSTARTTLMENVLPRLHGAADTMNSKARQIPASPLVCPFPPSSMATQNRSRTAA